MGIDGLSLSALVHELNYKLTGGRITKIYQVDKNTLTFWIRSANNDYCLRISANPENPGVHIISSPPENPAVPPAFCMLLRKHFEEGRISRIYQYGLDRIVILEVDIREERGEITTKSLIVEIMGKLSNIIFTTDKIIVDALKRVSNNVNRFRQILPCLAYQPPPGQQRLNILQTETIDFINALKRNENMSLVKAIISTSAGIGMLSAAEIVWRAGLPADITVDVMDKVDFISLAEAVDSVKSALNPALLRPNIVLDTRGTIKAIASFEIEHLSGQFSREFFCTMNEMMDYISRHKFTYTPPQQIQLTKLVEANVAKLIRKSEQLAAEITDANDAENLRKHGDILMSSLYRVEDHENSVSLPDIYSENPSEHEVLITLNPKLTAVQNAQAYYSRYAKLKRAQQILQVQYEHTIAEINYLEGILVALNNTIATADLDDIRQELITEGYLRESSNKKRAKLPDVSQPTRITTDGGISVVAGKNNRQNDYITFKIANQDDIWLHAKDIPGSHVLLRTGRQDPSDSDLETAAQIAAYFSKAKHSSNVPVDYTRRRYVKKPAGAKPGFVFYTNQNTIYVTPNPDNINSLLKKIPTKNPEV